MNAPLQFIANGLHDVISRLTLRTGLSNDTKRPRAWEEYGWPDEVEFDQCYRMWRRGGLAHGAIEKLVTKCWESDPWVNSGDETANREPTSPWEREFALMAKEIGLWRAFSRADRRRLIGKYAGLVLEFDDGRAWNEPVRRRVQLVGIRPVWQSHLKPAMTDELTGRVKSWSYISKNRTTTTIHPDRVFILGDVDEGVPFLRAAYNDLINIEKVLGGSGESFLKNSARQLGLEFNEGGDMGNLARAYGKTPEELGEVLDQMTRDFNSGIDAMLAVQGAKITPIVTNVPQPMEHFMVNAMSACAAWDMPVKILVGNQTGERASTEDLKHFNKRCQQRRTHELFPEIVEFVRHLMRVNALPTVPEVTVEGDDLTEATMAEKLENADKMATVNQKMLAAGEPVFTVEEIREAAGASTDDPLPELPAEGEDDE